MQALKNVPATTPDRSSTRTSSRRSTLVAILSTSAIANAAPANAETGTDQPATPAQPAPIANTAPTAAPPETPSTYGSASGFLRSAWNVAPARPKAPPTSAASTARGSRRSRVIATAIGSPLPESPSHTPLHPSPTAPKRRLMAIAATTASTKPANTAPRLIAPPPKHRPVPRGGFSQRLLGRGQGGSISALESPQSVPRERP